MTREELAALVPLAADGDDAAWERIVVGHAALVRYVISGLRVTGADAEDVTQATWLQVIRSIGRVEDPAAFPAWLWTVARNECLRHLRRRPLLYGEGFLEHLEDGTPGPEEELIAAEEAAGLRQAIGRLPGRQRQLMEMLAADASYDDVTRLTGMPAGSIGPMRMRAAAKLRGELARAGVLEP